MNCINEWASLPPRWQLLQKMGAEGGRRQRLGCLFPGLPPCRITPSFYVPQVRSLQRQEGEVTLVPTGGCDWLVGVILLTGRELKPATQG